MSYSLNLRGNRREANLDSGLACIGIRKQFLEAAGRLRVLRFLLGFAAGGSCNRRRCLSVGALDASSLPAKIAQVVQPGPAHFTLTHHLNGANARRVQWENSLNPHAKAYPAHREGR